MALSVNNIYIFSNSSTLKEIRVAQQHDSSKINLFLNHLKGQHDTAPHNRRVSLMLLTFSRYIYISIIDLEIPVTKNNIRILNGQFSSHLGYSSSLMGFITLKENQDVIINM